MAGVGEGVGYLDGTREVGLAIGRKGRTDGFALGSWGGRRGSSVSLTQTPSAL